MLLRRFMQHVKEQNWFAVGLDFVIVVVGVFIGIQVANWNDKLQDRKAYHEAYARMVSEVRRNIANQRDVLDMVLPIFREFQQATEDLRLCRADDDAKARIANSLYMFGITLSPSIELTAINTLTSSERLLEQQSSGRRDLYARYARFLNTRERWSQTASTKSNAHNGVNHPMLSVDAPDSLSDRMNELRRGISYSNRQITLIADIDEACKDSQLLQKFYNWEIETDYQLMLMQVVTEESESFLETLGEPLVEGDSE